VYLKLLVIPYPLTHDYYPYQIPLMDWSYFSVILSLLIYAALGVLAVIKLKRKSLISFAIFFFAITLSIQSNLLLNIGTFMNERFMFVALIGFCIVVAMLIRRISGDSHSKQKPFPKPALYFFVFIMAAFSVITFSRNFAWKDSDTLVLTDVKTSVNSARCNYIAGFTLLQKARKERDAAKKMDLYKQSAEYLEHGLTIYGKNTSALGNLGEVYIALGRYEEARGMYMKVLEQYPGHQNSIYNLRVIANIYIRDTKFNEAFKLLNQLAFMQPSDPTDFNTIGEVYGKFKNNLDSAEFYFSKALERKQDFLPALENMGLVYGMRKNYAKSLEYMLRAYPLDSANVNLLRNMSSTYTNLGNQQKADEMFMKANLYGRK
jgi:protein O-mannosyl-transferase